MKISPVDGIDVAPLTLEGVIVIVLSDVVGAAEVG